MILLSLLIILLLVFSLIRFSIHNFFSPLAEQTHLFCMNNLPGDSFSIAELKALVCAESFSSLGHSQLYISSGLIHLFVVSGAHLILIEKLLNKLTCNRILIFTILIIYGFACNLNAPVVRCLIAFTLGAYLVNKNIYWPAHFRLLIIGCLTLGFNYNWITSLSLQMSWIAAFLLILGEHFYKENSLLFKQSLFFISLLPTVVYFQIPSPIIILINILLAPILEFILFPLGLLVWFFNFLSPVFDFLILAFKSILQSLELDYQIQLNELPPHLIFYNWCLIFILHTVFHLVHVAKKRKLIFL